MTESAAPDPALVASVAGHRLLPPGPSTWTRLAGGVSSDIWRVDAGGQTICVKRALPQLRVAAEWHAPLDRNAYEWAWLQFAATASPGCVPVPLADDPRAGWFAMGYLPPERFPVWKQQLLAGQVDELTASAVGDLLGRLHRASAHQPDLARAFDAGVNFHALRLEPYFLAAAAVHPTVRTQLEALVERTATSRIALMHGDVSPKNILVGPDDPVLLDAECACYGDPAFDLAFCVNHLLLKCIARPQWSAAFASSARALVAAYLVQVDWEDPGRVDQRAATLLPALLLARVDGKSPVEYLDSAAGDRVRTGALALLRAPVRRTAELIALWT